MTNLVLLLLDAATGIVGSWIKRPPRMPARITVLVFVALLLSAAFVKYLSTRPSDDEAGTSVAASPGSTRSATPAPNDPTTPSNPPGSGPAVPNGRAPAGPRQTAAGGTAANPDGAGTVGVPSRFVAANRFQRFGGTHGAFTYTTSGTTIQMTVPSSNDSQWGGVLNDYVSCNSTVEFDVRVAGGAVDYYGFAVLMRGEIVNDQPTGDAILFYRDTDGTSIAKFSSLPTPGVGGVGAGSYPVANLHQRRHVIVAVHGATHTVTVDNTPAGDFAETELTGCGRLAFAAWGGASVTIENVLVR